MDLIGIVWLAKTFPHMSAMSRKITFSSMKDKLQCFCTKLDELLFDFELQISI